MTMALRILLVDEHPDRGSQLARGLTDRLPGVRVDQVRTALDLVHALDDGEFDLVLTETLLTWSEAAGVISEVKSRYPDCPVIMASANGDDPRVLAAFKAGLDGFVAGGQECFDALAAVICRTARQAANLRQTSRSEMRLRKLLNGLNVGVFRATLEGRLLDGNVTLVKLLGCSSLQQARTINVFDWLFGLDERDRLLERLTQEREVVGHEIHVMQEPKAIWLSTRASLASDSAGNWFVDGLVEDVTRRKETEEERIRLQTRSLHAQRLESLGVLAGGIAHDFNNLLTAIRGRAELALLEIGSDHPARESVLSIEIAARRAADLTNNLLVYAGKERLTIEPLDLSETVAEMVRLLHASIRKKIALDYELAGNLPAVHADRGHLWQVVMNLVTNAAEAIGDRAGTVRVRTGLVEADRAFLDRLDFGEALPEGPYAFVEVTDDGCGMDAPTRARIFDPFFTTKATGRGLGLAAVLGIVRAHRGGVKLASTPGSGTTFTVYMPCGEAPAAAIAEPTSEPEALGGATVLVIDDEEPVRDVAQAVLETYGYRVLLANDGGQGLERFREHADAVDIVLLDMNMPVLDGGQVLAELRRLRPELPVVLCSGYEQPSVAAGERTTRFLKKPFGADELVSSVQALLSAGR